MKSKSLTQVLERVETWPAEWQEQLAEIALDRGLRSCLATDEEVEAAFTKFRGA